MLVNTETPVIQSQRRQSDYLPKTGVSLELYTPEVMALADRFGIPRPVGHRKIFDCWFLQLHEVCHHLVLSTELRRWGTLLAYEPDLVDKPCAPMVPEGWLIHNRFPNENGVRLLCLDICELYGWANPYDLYPKLFGGSGYNIKQWSLSPGERLQARESLRHWSIDVKAGVFTPVDDGFRFPIPDGRHWVEILQNHQAAYDFYGWESTEQYDKVFVRFLQKTFATCPKSNRSYLLAIDPHNHLTLLGQKRENRAVSKHTYWNAKPTALESACSQGKSSFR